MPFVREFVAYGDRRALITVDGELSYRELTGRVHEMGERLGVERRLVLVTGGNAIDPIVTYLAALAGGHPVLLVPENNDLLRASLIANYDPDVIADREGDQWQLVERRHRSSHDLHPDLALLLCTSGSTGSPKLVRLSHENLQANADAIADYLDIASTDRSATTLPMHYCYGLSSHLSRGAGLVLTDLSVVERCFWELFAESRCTSFASVPYTFDLLDRIGFPDMVLPHLRYVTQAGGRLAPDRVAQYAELADRAGWDFFVMYGQTEATARMAYLPPKLAGLYPDAIGVPIPGGARARARARVLGPGDRRVGLRGAQRHAGLCRVVGRPGTGTNPRHAAHWGPRPTRSKWSLLGGGATEAVHQGLGTADRLATSGGSL